MFTNFKYYLLIFICCALLSCISEKDNGKLFTLVPSDDSGIDFVNQLTFTSEINIIEYLYFYNGGGVAVGDVNNDGLEDVFFTANQGSNKLYLNQGNFVFKDISNASGISVSAEWSTGVTMADVNADGWLDIYVSQVGGYRGLKGHNLLYINNGDLTFSEKSSDYGLDFQGFGTQAVFFDYDRDGDLDVYLLNHSVHSVGNYGRADILRNQQNAQAGDRLLVNQLAQGQTKFVDATDQSGIYSSPIGYGLGVSVADINNDQWLDIYVTNDFHENDYLYINQGDGTFEERLEQYMPHTSRYAMGNDIGDINGDGNLDIIATDMLPSDPSILLKSGGEDKQEIYDIKLNYGYGHQLARNTMQLNRGNGKFTDIALLTSTFATDWSWAPLITDLNNDGLEDIYITNGIYKRPNDLDYIQYISNLSDFRYTTRNEDSINKEMIKRMPTLKISNAAYINKGELEMKAASDDWGLDEFSYSNGSAYADFDNDGDLDLVVNNVNQKAFLYRNNAETLLENNYLKISLRQDGYNINGLGARVQMFFDSVSTTKMVVTTRGFQSSVSPSLNFGLGNTIIVDSVVVHWPDGLVQVEKRVESNQHLVIEKKRDLIEAQSLGKSSQVFSILDQQIIDFKHTENLKFKDFNSEYLLPYRLSVEGPAVASGDLNGDGLDDIYLGGASGQAAKIFIQNSNGTFKEDEEQSLNKDSMYEDTYAQFFDADNDNDLDLLVLSGGHQYPDGFSLLQDRLYINEKGIFKKSQSFITTALNSSSFKPLDYDQDGDLDLIIGFGASRGLYGVSGGLELIENLGNGLFRKSTIVQPAIDSLSAIITDVITVDVDNDGDMDFVAVGHWTPITLFINNDGSFDQIIEIPQTSGFWNSIESADLDADGDLDFIVGNIGLNNKFKASTDYPLKLYVSDFDENGTTDPLIMYAVNDRYIPILSKDELTKQIPSINKGFKNYNEYGELVYSIEDLFNEEVLMESTEESVVELRSIVLLNEDTGYKEIELPLEFQFSSIKDILIDDFNEDSIPDLLTGGNHYYTHISLGRHDGDFGSLAFGNGDGTFNYVSNDVSGICVEGQVSHINKIIVAGVDHYFFSLNNDSITTYRLK